VHPKLSCNKEDLKKYRFNKGKRNKLHITLSLTNNYAESLEHTLGLLCFCEAQKPDVAKAAYECFKKYENDDYTLLKCEKPLAGTF
jgi:hypothetical protein